MRQRRLLITGAGGFLGWHLARAATASWEVYGTLHRQRSAAPRITTLVVDLTDRTALGQLFRDIRPQAVIHAAAAADPEFCERHPGAAFDINVQASSDIAALCAQTDARLVFVSTDIVFDGRSAPYDEQALPSPINVYGRQKAWAEKCVRRRCPHAVICRPALIFGPPAPGGDSFLQPLLAGLRSGRAMPLFVDEFRTPVSVRALSAGLLLAAERTGGILHLGGRQRVSRFAFAHLCAAIFGLDGAPLIPCSQKSANVLASRPPDVALDSRKAAALGFDPHDLATELMLIERAERQPAGC